MFSVLSLALCYGLLSHIFASAKQCDPANHICSGRCPKVPPKVELPSGVAICMKDSITLACVCWLQSDTGHSNNLFLCEAFINGSITQVLCNTPLQCFPPDSEPTCLVIPYCNCILMNEDSSSLEFGKWKPVKAIIKTDQSSEKYPDQVREFSLKHLLFLLGFVVAPLLCWCFLNFITEKKWRWKNVNCSEAQPINTDRSTVDQNLPTVITCDVLVDSASNEHTPPRVQTTSCTSNASSYAQKDVNPPSYEEVMCCSPSQADESMPPPPYESTIYERGGNILQSVPHAHSRSSNA